MGANNQLQRKDLVYPELSYKVIGILFEVFNELGPGLQERYYQRAVAACLQSIRIPFIEQARSPLEFQNRPIGFGVLDFLIDDKIVLELKRGNRFLKQAIDQVQTYLKTSNHQLGIIANFTSHGVTYKRILNLY